MSTYFKWKNKTKGNACITKNIVPARQLFTFPFCSSISFSVSNTLDPDVVFDSHALADLGAPFWTKIPSLSCCFWAKWSNSMLVPPLSFGAPLWEILDLPLSRKVPFVFSPNKVRNIVKLRGPGASPSMASSILGSGSRPKITRTNQHHAG